MSTTAAHVDRSTLIVAVNDPEHAERVTTALFTTTRNEVLKTEAVCWCCGRDETAAGPLELHHCNIERMLAEAIDWPVFAEAAKVGEVGWTHNQREKNRAFDWDGFLVNVEKDPQVCYDYVDDMHLNGLPLCKHCHTGKGSGIHAMDYPRWIAQRYLKAGYVYSDATTIESEALRLKAADEDEAA